MHQENIQDAFPKNVAKLDLVELKTVVTLTVYILVLDGTTFKYIPT